MDELSFPDVSILAAPLYVLLIAAEVAFLRGKGRGEEVTKDLWTNLAMGTGNAVSSTFLYGGVAALMLFAWEYRVFELPITWWSFLIAMVAKDFVYYWVHRLQHRIRWGWANHVIHHSSQGYNLSTALRQPWFGMLTGTYVLSIPVIMLGVHPALFALAGALNLFYQFFIHTQSVRRLPGWVEFVFNTPSHHRVHHATNPRYLDTNYAGILILWDRLFGTFVAEDDSEPCHFGIVSNLPTQNPFYVASHEYIAIARDVTRPGLKPLERLRYVFAPPGYSHDGSRLTTAEIKRRAGLRLSGGQGSLMSAAHSSGALPCKPSSTSSIP
ncbi:MAG: sterol desaturase family protein [Parvularcula sp.]|jgi:sterol desaturase/sphingolipid hydroxylase (fatty acid hydroxylase superfamily)|nr:sterol desaturase family protein [Parvularcula sp.]